MSIPRIFATSLKSSNSQFHHRSWLGNGACFEGSYSYTKGSVKAIKDYAPKDETLHRIALDLQYCQRQCFYRISAHVKHSGHYYHSLCTNIDVIDDRTEWEPENAEGIRDALRDFMHWMYKQLETQYWYLVSEEAIKEAIQANEYEFYEDGTMV